jgi:hypothetical protein
VEVRGKQQRASHIYENIALVSVLLIKALHIPHLFLFFSMISQNESNFKRFGVYYAKLIKTRK